MFYYLAIDIGASSGRHIVGWMENGQCKTREVYRFPNGVMKKDGHLVWDVEVLFVEVKKGIAEAFKSFGVIESLSIDTWGVDYVRLKGDKPLLPCFAYRDPRTETAVRAVHDIVPFEKLYEKTGCQFQPFNTIYQLYDDLTNGRLEGVTDFLMMPEYLIYRLTGKKAHEYTNATTTGLVNAESGRYDVEIIDILSLPKHLFTELSQPGTVVGTLLPEVAREVAGQCNVVLCATHDTASAVAGIPMEGNAPYISSGTWSLLGIKTPKAILDQRSRVANFSNEGGIGYFRYQKNIMGMWLINELKNELCPEMNFSDVVDLAKRSKCEIRVDANKAIFLAPNSMKAAFDAETGGQLKTLGDYFRCAYQSLALCYRNSILELEQNTGISSDSLYIVGGGAKNQFLNELTREITGKNVIALPIEATALGNLKLQIEVK